MLSAWMWTSHNWSSCLVSGDSLTQMRGTPQARSRRLYPRCALGIPTPNSTSFVERQNLTMRMQIRRLTRLTNAFSKKLENLKAAVALHFAWYNFVRVHRSLRVTPGMQAGLTDHIWGLGELVGILQK